VLLLEFIGLSFWRGRRPQQQSALAAAALTQVKADPDDCAWIEYVRLRELAL
jgi:hypothetical protein